MLCEGKKIGSLFFYSGKPYCQNSGQTVGSRKSLYEFLSRPIELKYVSAASWVMDQPGDRSLFYKPPAQMFLYTGLVISVRKNKEFPWESHTQVTRVHWKSQENILPKMYPTFSTAVGRKPDFNKIIMQSTFFTKMISRCLSLNSYHLKRIFPNSIYTWFFTTKDLIRGDQ